MSSGLAMTAHLLLERLSPRAPLPRVPEPEPIMVDCTQNAAFEQVGREDGILAFVHLYQTLQITPLVRPGDRVLDLGCGPANQLVQIARFNPQAHFIGLDASSAMLDQARETARRCGAANIETVRGDMMTLSGFGDGSFDTVISTMALHHLPDEDALARTMLAARRVLKPDGVLYLVDFGRFKRRATQRFFADDRRDHQPEAFTRDYFNSLRAAFSVEELSRALRVFGNRPARYQTALAPFMIVFKSPARREPDATNRRMAGAVYAGLSAVQQYDFQLYARWFRIGGLALPFTPG
jgi:ubiquinone/menaquinone biosynthesis C-methylase UbiE